MRVMRWAILAAGVVGLFGSASVAQQREFYLTDETPPAPTLSPPGGPVIGTDEPAAAPVLAPPEEPAVGGLMELLGLDDRPVQVYGWIQNSFTGNTNGTPPSGVNFALFPNHLANQWMGNQYYIVVENALERAGRPNLGFRVDTLFGNDAEFTQAFGFLEGAIQPNRFGNVDLPQIFGELHLPVLTPGGFDLRGGRWYNFAGFEAVPAIQRPLLSWSYLMPYFPFTFSGMLGTLHVSERLNLRAGMVTGMDRWFDPDAAWNPLAGLTWTSPSERTVYTTLFMTGRNPTIVELAQEDLGPVPPRPVRPLSQLIRDDRTYLSNTLTHRWSERLTQAGQIEWILARDTLGPPPQHRILPQAQWYGFTHWFLYEFTDKTTGVWRSGIFRDADGVATGIADTYYEMTLGLICKPKPCLWIRPETRYDWAQFKTPFSDGTRSSRFTIGFDVIVLF